MLKPGIDMQNGGGQVARDGFDLFAPAVAQRGAAGQEEIDVGPEAGGKFVDEGRRGVQVPEFIEGGQNDGGVAAAAPEAGCQRGAFAPQDDARALRHLQQRSARRFGGTEDEVVVVSGQGWVVAFEV